MILRLLFSFFLLFSSLQLHAQGEVRMLFYNLLNFPDPNPHGKWDTLKHILEFHPVDLLMVCELKTEAGADSILYRSLNVDGINHYDRADFVPMQSNPSTSHRITQLVFYDTRKMGLLFLDTILTETRDINRYVLYLKDPQLTVHQDTTFLDVYVTHLKSSQGDQNVAKRERMVDSLYTYWETQPPFSNVIFAGDLNVYTSSEPAYQKLIDPFTEPILVDPIDSPGSWHNNGTHRSVHTQSTRSSSLFGDGAGGGMDDRFDFILLSDDIMTGADGVTFEEGSYNALGNTGDCFNQSISQCDSTELPWPLLKSLFFMSDHLPITSTLLTAFPLGYIEKEEAFSASIKNSGAVGDILCIRTASQNARNIQFMLFDLLGRPLADENLQIREGVQEVQMPVHQLSKGIYLLSIDGQQVRRFVKR